MAGHEVFDQVAEVSSYNSHKQVLISDHPDWLPEQIEQQALIDFNTQMLPNQVRTYFAEKNGDLIGRVEQKYRIVEGRLVDDFYGKFQKMIDHATSDEEKITLEAFEAAAVQAKPGEIIRVLDTSALGRGEGIKYADTFEKTEEGLVVHKERIDLTGEGEDLSLNEAKIVLEQMNREPEMDKDFEAIRIALPMAVDLRIPDELKFSEPKKITEPENFVEPGRLQPIWPIWELAWDSTPALKQEQVEIGEKKEKTVQAAKIKEMSVEVPTRSNLVGQEVLVFMPVKREVRVEVEKGKEEKIEKIIDRQPTRSNLVGPKAEIVVIKKNEKKIKLVWQRGERKQLKPEKKIEARKIEKPKQPKIPIWEAALNPVDVKEIPWWQPILIADDGMSEAERIVVLAIFFLIVNTKRLQKIKISNF